MEIHFRNAPDETAVRALVALAAGERIAAALTFEPVAPADWVAAKPRRSAAGRAGRFIVHGAHDRARMSRRTASASRSRRRSPSAPAITAPRAAACWRSTLWRSGGGARNVLDLGTGSGVLAIAAARAFARRVTATDIDPLAVAAARANARLNRAGAAISFAPRHRLQRAASCAAARLTI